MAYCRRLFKYLYPKPRKKFAYFMILAFLCYMVFYMQKTSHRKAKLSRIPSNGNVPSVFSHEPEAEVERKVIAVDDGQVIDYRQKIPQNVYNVTVEPTRSVLVFTETEHSETVARLKIIFKSMKVDFDFLVWNHLDDFSLTLPRLVDKYRNSRYQAFMFTKENIFDYFDSYNWDLIKRHCQMFNVGMIVLCNPVQSENIQSIRLRSLPVSLIRGVEYLMDLEIPANNILSKVKSPNVLHGRPPGDNNILFYTRHKTFKEILVTNLVDSSRMGRETSDTPKVETTGHQHFESIEKSPMVLYDAGEIDGVRKFFFGISFWSFWLYQLLLVDALGVISDGKLGFGLKRYIQIDIDDMFVGHPGLRLIKEDVDALIAFQDYLATKIDGFKFRLGYSALRFKRSNFSYELEGDEYLVQNAKHFTWFCHTSSHIKPHMYSEEQLIAGFEANLAFAEEHDLNVDYTYAVAPHHSGVYPVHNPLYRAWKHVYGVKVTSTEGYPHLYPSYDRKGFIHDDIMVLPRQTCGLFTKTWSEAKHPLGPDYLYNLTQGGDLFWTFVLNPVNIYMTHMNNYGVKERLAIPLFTNVTNFIEKWTNLQLVHTDTVTMAIKYFEIFHKQLDPLWTDPCTDHRHQKIWNKTNAYCDPDQKTSTTPRLPDVLILGPQKTGTMALLTFLSLHPSIIRSRRSNSSYEEVQFFSKNNYKKGIDWYLDFFPEERETEDLIYIDKSANYFDSLKAPLRAYSLLPKAKLIVLLIDPRLRAYSWYQHIRSKNMFKDMQFYDIISTMEQTGSLKFDTFHSKCLIPGRYAEALERWLQYYDQSQLLILDGDELKERPVETLNQVQIFLGLSEFEFEKYLKFNEKKNFFCIYDGIRPRCLGRGKGRHYPDMTDKEWHFLTEYYYLPNINLFNLLKKLQRPIPEWLQIEMGRIEKRSKRS